MITEYKFNKFAWIDIESPTNGDISHLLTAYDLAPAICSDLSTPTRENLTISNGGQFYGVLHFASLIRLADQPNRVELDLIVTPDGIITLRHDPLAGLKNFQKEVEIEIDINQETEVTREQFLASLLTRLYEYNRMELSGVNEELKQAEEQIFSGKEKEMVRKISEIGRQVLNFKQSLDGHRLILNKARHSGALQNCQSLFSIWERELDRTIDKADELRELYHELRHTNGELLSTKQNEIMRILTMVAFITSPLTLLAGIFGMNVAAPLADNPNSFWIVITIMAASALLITLFFKAKRWF